MKKTVLRSVISATVLLIGLSMTVPGQDFQQSYRLGSGATVSVKNISGNVKVVGYNGDSIVVLGHKEGRDSDRVTIVDQSSGNNVSVSVKYPEECNCEASVNFEVRVPTEIRYRFDSFSSVSGDVSVTNVIGDLRAKSVSGSVTVNGVTGAVNATSVSGQVEVGAVNGTVSAKSTSGNVEVEIRTLEGAESMNFASVSGNVNVKLPANLDAEVNMSTMSGDLGTDFPLNIEQPERGRGRKATGRIGSGSRILKLSSVSGDVNLRRI